MRALPGVLSALLGATAAAADCDPAQVVVAGGFGRAAFAVQVADDAAERSRGLMDVERMGMLEGMLFVYERPGRASFWMENTLIPLDMLFADATGTITAIHADAIPLDRTPIRGGDDVQFVLEVNGGLARRLGIAVGDAMQHPAIDAAEGPAALPCS